MSQFATRLAPAKSRFDPRLEALKQHFRHLLQRELTAGEERWLELSAALLRDEELEQPTPQLTNVA